ncbi:MAG: tetratricopeptide repeat protein [Bacteroidales bacterium]
MKRLIFLVIVLTGCSTLTPLQRSKLITAFHLIEDANYKEAHEFIEEMAEDEEAAQWPRTWHARGLLYQNAYREGIRRNNKSLYELQPKQLFVAYESYEKALDLNAGRGIRNQLTPKYVLLANDFQKMGQERFNEKKYNEALEAFETAQQIRQSELLQLDPDTNLVYNMAITAIEGDKQEKAIQYLHQLDEYNYGTNVSHLLSAEYLQQGDTTEAKEVLEQGINKYEDINLVLLLVDLNFEQGNIKESLAILDRRSSDYPSNYEFPYTKGLILQKTGSYREAIDAYEKSLELEPEQSIIYAHIATCYFNIGIEIEEYARTLEENRRVMEERERSTDALESAAAWVNKALEMDTQDPETLAIISELSSLLEITERVEDVDNPAREDEASEESDTE